MMFRMIKHFIYTMYIHVYNTEVLSDHRVCADLDGRSGGPDTPAFPKTSNCLNSHNKFTLPPPKKSKVIPRTPPPLTENCSRSAHDRLCNTLTRSYY